MKEKIYRLDEEDHKILKVLQQNCRLSYREISKLTKAGATTIHKKVQRWVKDGLIKRFTITIDWNLLGRSSLAYVSVLVYFSGETTDKYLELFSRITKYPYVRLMSSVSGRTDFMLRASAKTNDELNAFLNEIRSLEGVSRTETYVSLYDAKKEGTEKPEKLFPYKEIHLRILRVLQEDAKLSLREIGDKLGISHSLVNSHLKELVNEKVIRKFTIIVDRKMIGYGIMAYVLITFDYPVLKKLKLHQEEVMRRIIQMPQVSYATAVTGRIDGILYVVAEDMQKLDSFVTGLRAIKGIRRTETLVISHGFEREVDDMARLFRHG